MPTKPKVLPTGKKFGKLTVIKFIAVINGNGRHLCRCICGKEKSIMTQNLLSKTTRSCGCSTKFIMQPLLKKLGIIRKAPRKYLRKNYLREYSSWTHMQSRCYNKGVHNYHLYGGMGVQVSNEFLENFDNFVECLGRRPKNTTLHRIDPFGDYCRGNLKWADSYEQNSNKRNNYYKRKKYVGKKHRKL